MQIDWMQAILFPIVTGIILLGVEYFGIQRWLHSRETKVQSLSNSSAQANQRSWSDGIKKTVEQFKEVPSNYKWKWLSLKQNFITISQLNVYKGQAELTLGVTERFFLDFSKPKEIAKYKVLIDRAGNIYQFDEVPTKRKIADTSILPFPFSWVIIAIVMFAGIYSQFDRELPSDDIINGYPIAALWANAPQVFANSAINGSLAANEVNAYTFKSENGEKVTIRVDAVDLFRCYLSIYNGNNSLVRRILIYSREDSLNLAPELNTSYLIVIHPQFEAGGSYVLNISTTSNPTVTP